MRVLVRGVPRLGCTNDVIPISLNKLSGLEPVTALIRLPVICSRIIVARAARVAPNVNRVRNQAISIALADLMECRPLRLARDIGTRPADVENRE